jgi:transcriptional regulator with XRE-family HTH domain
VQIYGWTHADLSKESGVMKQAISSIEHNKIAFGRRRAAAFARALRVDPSVFLDGVERHAVFKRRKAIENQEVALPNTERFVDPLALPENVR